MNFIISYETNKTHILIFLFIDVITENATFKEILMRQTHTKFAMGAAYKSTKIKFRSHITLLGRINAL